jgi:predicted lactoylglutathione lyase
MKLGKFVEISVAVPDLAKSLFFFERLGFEKADQSWEPWPWAILSDGLITLSLSQTTPGSPVLNYLAGDMKERVAHLEASGIEMSRIRESQAPEVVAALATPCGIGVSLMEYPARRIPKPSGRSNCKCGKFSEFALPVEDLRSAVEFWNRVGFHHSRGAELPYPWAVVSDGLITLGLYETRDFDRPALIYYSANTAERIEQLGYDGFEFGREIPSVGQGIGRTILEPPDGQLLFMLEYHEEAVRQGAAMSGR